MSILHSIILLAVWIILLSGGVWGKLRCKKLKDDLSQEVLKTINALLVIIQVSAVGMIYPLATLFKSLCGFK